MRLSKGYIKTIKDEAKEYDSISHKLLISGGFIDQVSSGIYSLLTPAVHVLTHIENIIRKEMNEKGGQEIKMPALSPRSLWETTSRWDSFDILFKVKGNHNNEYALGASHEEVVTPLAKKYINSYKDLPLALYQIGTKFRDEARAKSGILRGREFRMKDLYSFHADEKDFKEYYKGMIQSYIKIFNECGLEDVKITEASGGDFTKKISHEFNVITPAGEVDLVYCANCAFAKNKELVDADISECPVCSSKNIKTEKAIEVGNIFDLGLTYSPHFALTYTDEKGAVKPVFMGCYGIGVSRLLGALIETHHDDDGMLWPKTIAPFHAHLINLMKNDTSYADLIERTLEAEGFDVLYDDRRDITAGEKFATADLIGIPIRLIVSDKHGRNIELKERGKEKTRVYTPTEIVSILRDFYV